MPLELLLESVCNSVKLPQERDCSVYCTLFVLMISQQYRCVNVPMYKCISSHMTAICRLTDNFYAAARISYL